MEEIPPTNFSLRPHHLEVLKVFSVAFHEMREQTFPPQYMLHLYRVLMHEVAEVEEPRTHEELNEQLKSGPSADSHVPVLMIRRIEDLHTELQTYDGLYAFLKRIPPFVYGNKQEGETCLFHRRSLFGFFIRRCLVSFSKLSFGGVVRLLEDYQAWYSGDTSAGYHYDPKNDRDTVNHDMIMFKTVADKQSFGDPVAYTEWEKSMATGDEALAVDSISRYFEQRFTGARDSKNRQYLLLHVIHMHYLRHEYGAVRKLLQEAISICRTNGDKIALQHCKAILHRLPPTERGQKPTLNTIQPELHPLEILYDMKKLMQVQNEQPLSASFERIVSFLGWYDQWVDVFGNIPSEREQCGLHAVQSVVWSMAGCNRLSAISENTVIAFTEVGGDDNNRLTVTLNQAYRRARQGEYDKALSMLLEPDVWRGLTLDDYVAWAGEIWHILVLRASRRGQNRLFREFLKSRRPAGPFNPKEYFFDSSSAHLSVIRDPIYEVIQMKASDQGSAIVDKLLVALWHAEFQCRYGLYRSGLILLADIGLEFGMTKKSRRMLEEIMPQIINGDEHEQRAFACFTLARCIISTGHDREDDTQSAESLQLALFYLRTAEHDYLVMEMYQSAKHVQYLIAVVYHNLGMFGERDVAVKRHFETAAKYEQISGEGADRQTLDIFNLISEVGVGLAGR